MATTIADLWLLTRGDLIPDIRGTLIRGGLVCLNSLMGLLSGSPAPD